MSVNTISGPGGAGRTDPIHRALTRLLSIDGLVSACLVEPESAYVLDTVVGAETATPGSGPSAAAPDQAPPTAPTATTATVAAGASDVVQVIGLMMSGLGETDSLEDVIITLGRCHHLIMPVPTAGTDGLLVVVTLDRVRTNLALARRQLQALGPLLKSEGRPGHGG